MPLPITYPNSLSLISLHAIYLVKMPTYRIACHARVPAYVNFTTISPLHVKRTTMW